MAYVHFAFLGQESLWAAEASECAAEQDAFWEYHDYLYDSQNGENRGAFNKENLYSFAEILGLDTDQFNQCLDLLTGLWPAHSGKRGQVYNRGIVIEFVDH